MNHHTPHPTPDNIRHAELIRTIRQSQSPIAAERAIGSKLLPFFWKDAATRLTSLRPYTVTWDLQEIDGALSLLLRLNCPFPVELQDVLLVRAIALVLQQELGVESWAIVGTDEKGYRVNGSVMEVV